MTAQAGGAVIHWTGEAAMVAHKPDVAPRGTPSADGNGRLARIARDGVIAGLIGYGAIAVMLAVLSVARGNSPLHLATLIGSTLFPGTGSAAFAAYNLLHLTVFLAVGLFLSASASLSERAPQAWYPMVVLVMFVGGHIIAAPFWFDAGVQAELPLWGVAALTLLAALPMGAFLWSRHPGIRAAAHEPDDPQLR
jgi:hypothetical protein